MSGGNHKVEFDTNNREAPRDRWARGCLTNLQDVYFYGNNVLWRLE